GPYQQVGQTDENTPNRVLSLTKGRDTCQPLTTREKHASRNQVPSPNVTEQPRDSPNHAGIRTTTRNSTRTLTRATESISNDCIGRLLESVSSIERFGKSRSSSKVRPSHTTNSSLTSITPEEYKLDQPKHPIL
ncbi:unnamed protein product, partial [Brassica rapa subsp. trilocularis]